MRPKQPVSSLWVFPTVLSIRVTIFCALRVDVSLHGNGTIRFGSDSDFVSVSLADAYTGTNTNTNWFAIRMEITRTLVSGVFHISVEVTDLDKNEAIGMVDYLAEDSSTYNATGLLPAMRTLQVGVLYFRPVMWIGLPWKRWM